MLRFDAILRIGTAGLVVGGLWISCTVQAFQEVHETDDGSTAKPHSLRTTALQNMKGKLQGMSSSSLNQLLTGVGNSGTLSPAALSGLLDELGLTPDSIRGLKDAYGESAAAFGEDTAKSDLTSAIRETLAQKQLGLNPDDPFSKIPIDPKGENPDDKKKESTDLKKALEELLKPYKDKLDELGKSEEDKHKGNGIDPELLKKLADKGKEDGKGDGDGGGKKGGGGGGDKSGGGGSKGGGDTGKKQDPSRDRKKDDNKLNDLMKGLNKGSDKAKESGEKKGPEKNETPFELPKRTSEPEKKKDKEKTPTPDQSQLAGTTPLPPPQRPPKLAGPKSTPQGISANSSSGRPESAGPGGGTIGAPTINSSSAMPLSKGGSDGGPFTGLGGSGPMDIDRMKFSYVRTGEGDFKSGPGPADSGLGDLVSNDNAAAKKNEPDRAVVASMAPREPTGDNRGIFTESLVRKVCRSAAGPAVGFCEGKFGQPRHRGEKDTQGGTS